MITADIDELMKTLERARLRGCTQVKLQLYPDWQDIEKEQQHPSLPAAEYQVDTRFYNTVEFESVIEDNEETGQLHAYEEGEVFVIRVSLSDAETLFRQLGLSNP